VYLKGITIMVKKSNKPTIVEPSIAEAVPNWLRSGKKLITTLRDEGKVWTDFLSPKNDDCTSTQEYYDGMKVVIATGLDKLDLYNEEPKGNEPRNELVREIGSKLKDIRKLLKPKAEKKEPRSDIELFMELLDKAQTRLADNEEMFANHSEVVDAMENLFNVIGD